MTTNEFIKLLQEEDPSGEGHIRLYDGTPFAAIAKEGYYDGYYTYLDKDDNFVATIKGYKIDIYCVDIDMFVERHFESCNRDWELIKAKFVFEFDGYNEENRQSRIDNILLKAREAYDLMMSIY